LEHDKILKELRRAGIPLIIYHGTKHAKMDRISCEGLLPGGPNAVRIHTMFSPYKQSDPLCKSGMRFNSEVLIAVDANLMLKEGIRLWETTEHAICTDSVVLPRYFVNFQSTSDGAIFCERPIKKDGTPDILRLEDELRNLDLNRPGSSKDDQGGAGGKPLRKEADPDVVDKVTEDEDKADEGQQAERPKLVLQENPEAKARRAAWEADQAAQKKAYEWRQSWWNSTKEQRELWTQQGWSEKTWEKQRKSWVPNCEAPTPESLEADPVCPSWSRIMLRAPAFAWCAGRHQP